MPRTRVRKSSPAPDPLAGGPPTVFLVGPPGVGKSAFGRLACEALGLRFLDPGAARRERERASAAEAIRRAIAERCADVIEVPWELQSGSDVPRLVRRSGVPLFLWSHPLSMQERSGRPDRLFTPVPRLKTHGGFGVTGTACTEFRRTARAYGDALDLRGLGFEKAADAVREAIAAERASAAASPVDREGLGRWAAQWVRDYGADPPAARETANAMARYLSHLRAEGRTARTIDEIAMDLDAAGHLVMMYRDYQPGRVLAAFSYPPLDFQFRRKFSDSPAALARYRSSLEGFARFLAKAGNG